MMALRCVRTNFGQIVKQVHLNVCKRRNLLKFRTYQFVFFKQIFQNTSYICHHTKLPLSYSSWSETKTIASITSLANLRILGCALHIAERSSAEATAKLKEFDLSFQDIYEELTVENAIPSSVWERFSAVINYNVLGGKKIRGMAVVSSIKALSRNKLTTEDLKLAYILGWCVELLQAFFIMSDDIMDNGITRRGKACWFRHPEVGLAAVNDALLLECCVYQLLRKHFANEKCYVSIVDEFHEATKKTIWGQSLDMEASHNGRKQLQKFTPNYYWTVVEYKTAYYTYCLPVRLAMHLVGSFSEEHYASAQNICLKLGKLFQMQDDYLDAYGNSALTGKRGSDIKEGKCTWLAVSALQNCSEDEKRLMEDNYGVNDAGAVNKVLELYDSLSLEEKYHQMEEQLHGEINYLIHELDDNVLKREVFSSLLGDMYRRQK